MKCTIVMGALVWAVAGVKADVTTNLWNGSAGGSWSATNAVGEYVNWVGGVLPAGTNVSRFQLDDQQTITASEVTYTGGLVFEPAALEQGEEAPESYQWWLNWQDNKDIYWTSTTPLG